MLVSDIARPRDELVTADANTSLPDLAGLMDEKHVGSVVIEENGTPVGIVTDRDIALQVVGQDIEPSEIVAGEVMTDEPITARPDQSILELSETMAEHGIRRTPVVEDGEMTGIVSVDDVFVLLDEELSYVSETLKADSPRFSG